ncbi:MAG: RluA family pseudouridine synthase [Chloroflexi bacterium]|nr:RluA family pseudouridine synthase [Chloroflexota bacterium]
MNQRKEYTASSGASRLDRFVSDRERSLTRSRIHSLIKQGLVTLNGRVARPSQKVRGGDCVVLTVPPPRELDLEPQDIPVSVIFQDSELAVVEKPAGLSVHPGPGHSDGTLVNALLALCPDIRGIGGVLRPGIVHRLDKDTSGLMVVAKSEKAHHSLTAQIKERHVRKGYLALTVGVPPQEEEVIDAPIARDPRNRKRMAVVLGGRESRTSYRVVKEWDNHALLELDLETGRTHQIRVHMAYLGYPLFGDPLYGRRNLVISRQFLHASFLAFSHPSSGEYVEFRSRLPADLRQALQSLGLDCQVE